MENSIYCEFCDKSNVSAEHEAIRIFTQKCLKCNRVSMNKVVKKQQGQKFCDNCGQPFLGVECKNCQKISHTCAVCHHIIVNNPTDICDKCKNIPKVENRTIMCCFCHMIPKTYSSLNDGGTIICSICNRMFHPTIIKEGKVISAHPYQGKGPLQCAICNS
jgi:hypothetical protein